MKPANVMVLDGTDVVKLIDFGIARFFKPGKRRDTIELGTDGYAPPEQYGKSQTDERADVYALGAMLHQLLTLRDPAAVPFQFPGVRSLNSEVSLHVDAAIAKAVQPAKEQRYESIEEFSAALFGNGRPKKAALRGKDRAAEKGPRPVPKNLLTTPDALDFGRVSIGGSVPFRLMKVDVPPGERVELDVSVPWLNVHPRNIDKSGDVTVTVYPQRLRLGRWLLSGLGWVAWPARFLVPAEREYSCHVKIESNGSTLQVPVSVVVVPSRGRVVAGWMATILVMSGVYVMAGVFLLLVLGVLGITAVGF
jgi:serine/threonine protein kinase